MLLNNSSYDFCTFSFEYAFEIAGSSPYAIVELVRALVIRNSGVLQCLPDIIKVRWEKQQMQSPV